MSEGDDRRVRRRILVEDEDEDEMMMMPLPPPNEPIVPAPQPEGDDELSNPDEFLDEQDEDEGVDGEDLLDTYEADYAPAPELDHYEAEYLADDDEVNEDWAEQYEYRAAADMEIDKRYAEFGKRQKERTKELIADDDGDGASEAYDSEEDDDEEEEQELNLEAFTCSLREWIAQDRTRRELLKKISRFLETYYEGIGDKSKPKGSLLYLSKIKQMCSKNRSSLEISYDHISKDTCSQLAIWLIDVPREMLQMFDEV
jgi:DNA replication licensing factor MCM2